jgi:hypothetical protein
MTSALPINYKPIPPLFYSVETGGPFCNCLTCNKHLLDDGTSYVIEKSIKRYPELNTQEVIFEYALCMDCSFKLNAALSEESRQLIARYFNTNVNFAERSKKFLDQNEYNLERWLERCLIKQTPLTQANEYQLIAQFEGNHIVYTQMPFALSFEAITEIASLLSPKTLGEMDSFIGNFFSGPPEVAAILKRSLVFV